MFFRLSIALLGGRAFIDLQFPRLCHKLSIKYGVIYEVVVGVIVINMFL